MKNIKGILFFDIDGTLINSSHELTARTKEALVNAYQNGYKIALASGRCIDGLRIIRDKLPIPIIQLTMNGAYNVAEDGSLISESFIDKLTSLEIKKLMDKYALELLYFSRNEWYTEFKGKLYEYEYSVVKHAGKVFPLKEAVEIIPIHKLLAYSHKAVTTGFINECKQLFPMLNIASSSPSYVEINKADADKGMGIVNIAKYYNVDIKNTIMFGDYDNDIAGFKAAGKSVAMANATQNLLKHATATTLSNDEDGIAYYIENYLL